MSEVDPGSEIAQSPPGGLLSGIKRESNTPSAPAEQAQAPAASDAWFWDEGVPGNGPKPAWLKEKYTNIAAQAKAYVEAEKQLGQLGSAPEDYSLVEGLDATDPFMQRFMETAKKTRMPQEAFGEMLNTLMEYEASKMPNVDAEIAKLGNGAHEKIETVRRWASNNLSQEACDVLGQIGNRAEVINFLDEIRQLSIHQASQPPGSTDNIEGFVKFTQEDWDAELAIPANAQRYLQDSKYRAEMSRKLKVIMGEE